MFDLGLSQIKSFRMSSNGLNSTVAAATVTIRKLEMPELRMVKISDATIILAEIVEATLIVYRFCFLSFDLEKPKCIEQIVGCQGLVQLGGLVPVL